MTHARNLEPLDLQILLALAPLVGNGKAVRFIAGVLQQLQRGARTVQDDALAVVGEDDFFKALRKADKRQVLVVTQLL